MKFTKMLKVLTAAVSLSAVTAAFFGVPYCDFACRLQPSLSYWFLGIVALTFLWGRFFCEAMCPLGILQSLLHRLFHPKTPVRRVCSRLPETRLRRIVRYTIAVVFAALVASGVGAAWLIAPYSIYGKALALFLPGLVLLAVVLLTAAFGKGRFWCNTICPFGTLFTVLSRFSLRTQKVGRCCGNCRACFPASAPAAADKSASSDDGLSRRATLKGMAVLAAVKAVDKTTDGGFAPISLHDEPTRERSVLPPGAGSRARFSRLCVGCELCVRKCPGECLTPSLKLKSFGQPEMTFGKGHCIIGCTTCGDICPARAIEALDEETKLNTHVGFARWHQDRCLRSTRGYTCRACEKKCPVGAIHLVDNIPVVDRAACIGCGACEHVCPVRPLPALTIEGYDEQRMIRPIGEQDLVDEMMSLVHGGKAIVVARDGVITQQREGSGVKPILDLLEEDALKDALVADKIIGRAAAAACVLGGAKKVSAIVMSKGAKAFLNAHGIPARAEQLVPVIINRKGDGPCPMEERVRHLSDPREMVEALKTDARRPA